MLSPQKLYDSLSHLSLLTFEHGEPDLANDLQGAMNHYVLPLTSEFYGISMAALKKMLASNQDYFSREDKELAAIVVREIEEKWFTPPR